MMAVLGIFIVVFLFVALLTLAIGPAMLGVKRHDDDET